MLSSRICLTRKNIIMDIKDVGSRAAAMQAKARGVLSESGIVGILEDAGLRVNLIGSLKMGLLAAHRDIDMHVYSEKVTTDFSFSVMAKVARNERVTEIKCINGLHTDEHCIAWHVFYKAADGEIWQLDIIHIESGSHYDGYFERMASRICEVMTDEQRDTILRLKFETSETRDYHGVEYYEAVIADGVRSVDELDRWVRKHRKKEQYYWIP